MYYLRKRSAIIFLNMLQLITTDITLNTSNRILNASIKRVKKKTFFFFIIADTSAESDCLLSC